MPLVRSNMGKTSGMWIYNNAFSIIKGKGGFVKYADLKTEKKWKSVFLHKENRERTNDAASCRCAACRTAKAPCSASLGWL
ncbi:MAG: hypothetical protein Q3Y08_08390 [Butyricicoccus sp.]|nr:hypothetical protein [Butyricicoccus sp.]